MWAAIIEVALSVLMFFINRSKSNAQMREAFLKFIEKADVEYQRAALQRLESKRQNNELDGKEFSETK